MDYNTNPDDDLLQQALLARAQRKQQAQSMDQSAQDNNMLAQALVGLSGAFESNLRGQPGSDVAIKRMQGVQAQEDQRRKLAALEEQSQMKEMLPLIQLRQKAAEKSEGRTYQEGRDQAKFANDEKLAKIRAENRMSEIGAKADAKASANSGGKRLSEKNVLDLSQASTIPSLVSDFREIVDKNRDKFGPVAGRLEALNPYSELGQAIDGFSRNVRQTIGKIKEGGVLRKEDEVKYEKMLPKLSDTPEVAMDKISTLEREMLRDYGAKVGALGKSGYDISGLPPVSDTPELPTVLTKGKAQPKQAQQSVVNSGGIDIDISKMTRAQKLDFLRGK